MFSVLEKHFLKHLIFSILQQSAEKGSFFLIKPKMSKKTIKELYLASAEIIETARGNLYGAANMAMLQAYWLIGKTIVEDEQGGQQRATYGKQTISKLSNLLGTDFGTGFDENNLRYMRAFYLNFPDTKQLHTELTWSHYRLLLGVEKKEARHFYLNEAIRSFWNTAQLRRQINSMYYERLLLSTEKKAMRQLAKEENQSLNPQHFIKDSYVLEFLEIQRSSTLSEKDLETALIDKLQDFLLELGRGFSFVSRQQRISTATGKHYSIDLVFYNYLLKCFVLIDLKIGELTHRDIGQMDMYVRMYEDKMKTEGDNPTIGLILCNKKDETVVKYSMLSESQQIFASKYQLYLPTEKELAQELQREVEAIELEQYLKKRTPD